MLTKDKLRLGYMNADPEYMIKKAYEVMRVSEGLHPVTQICMMTYPFLIMAYQLDLNVSDLLSAIEKHLLELEGKENKWLGAMVTYIKDEIFNWKGE